MTTAAVGENLTEVRERIAAAALAAGRAPAAGTLVVVTKEVGIDQVRAAISHRASDCGANRAKHLAPKAAVLTDPAPRWHFIGRLQRNKVRAIAPYVALWQSVDRADLAAEIGRRAPGAAVLVQVNVTGEQQKGGCAPDEAATLVEACEAHGCRVQGLMTVPEAEGDPRPAFARLRRMTDDLGLAVCSMGM